FFFSSRRRHTRFDCDWSSDVCSSDLRTGGGEGELKPPILEDQWVLLDGLGMTAEDRRHLLGRHAEPNRAEFAGSQKVFKGRHLRSEERRVGKEWRSGWWPSRYRNKEK